MPSILIVGDEDLPAEDLGTSLRHIGYDLAGRASSEADAFRLVETCGVDLILMDVELHGRGNGIETAERIRRRFDIPIVFLTTFDETDVLSRSKKVEPYGYVNKPVRLAELRNVIESALYKHEADKRTRESEIWMRGVFDALEESVVTATPDKIIKDVNPATERIFGYKKEEIIGGTTAIFHVDHDHYTEFGRRIAEAFRKGESAEFGFEMKRKEGEVFSSHHTVSLLRDRNGFEIGIVSVIRDTSESKRIQRELIETRATLQAALDHSKAGIAIADAPSGKLLYVNEAGLVIRGGDRESAVEGVGVDRYVSAWQILDLDGTELDRDDVPPARAVLYGETAQREFIIRRAGNDDRIVMADAAPIKDEQGRVTAAIVVFMDITDIKKAQEALRISEARYRVLAENTLDIIWQMDPDLRFTYVNHAITSMTGFTVDEWIGSKLSDHCDEENFSQMANVMAHKVAQGAASSGTVFETEMLKKDGDPIQVEIHGKIVFGEDGAPTAVQGVARDISDRKRGEQALRESEERYRALFERAGDAITLVDVEGGQAGRIVSANKVAAEMHGYDMDEFTGLSMSALDHPDDSASVQLMLGTMERGHTINVEHRHLKKDGSTLLLELSAGPIEIRGHRYSLSISRDITERKRAETERRLLATAVEQAAESVEITDSEGTIVYVNPAFEKTTGFSRSEVIGKRPNILGSGRHDEAFFRGMWTTITNKQTWEGHVVNRRKDGSLFEEDVTISPVSNESGEIVNYVAVKRDLSNEALLRKQLLEAQKMEVVGALTGGIAHDFNNLLQVIHGSADIGLVGIGKDQAGYTELVEIKKAAKRAAELTQGLLTFSRRAAGKKRSLDLNAELNQIARMLQRTIPKNIAIELDLASDLRAVKADPGQLQQSAMNLALNARDAMPDGGRIVMQTANVRLEEHFCSLHPGIEPGNYVMLAIADTGCGMNEATLASIFDPFFTTKEEGKGTGLGLSIVLGIVKSHGGAVTCDSEPGRGSTFRIYLPAIKQAQGTDEEPQSELPAGGTETILLADDEDAIRRLGERMLKKFGYSVITAADGREALRLFEEHKQRIAVVILDLVMPEMGGRECLREILRIDPAARVLIASGDGAEGQIDGALAEGARASVKKPYDAGELLQTLRRLLDE